MDFLSQIMPWLVGIVVIFVALALLCGPMRWLGRILVRTVVGIILLFATSSIGGLIGIHLGVNMINALVVGILGVPGFGLLLLFNWTL